MSGQSDRPSRLPYTIAILVLLGLVAAAWFGQDRIPHVGPGVPAPDFRATTLDGEPRTLEDVRGKVVLLNIWATWCQPCVEEMPAIQRLEDAIDAEDFQVVAVSVDARSGQTDEFGRPGGDIRAFLEEHGIDFTVWHDPSGDIQDLYRTTGVPETFFIDRDGTILRRVVGPAEYDSQAYQELVRRMLGEG